MIGLGAEKNEEWSEKRDVFCSYNCFQESENLSCDKNLYNRAKFSNHMRLFQTVFDFRCSGGLNIILFLFRSDFAKGFQVSNISYNSNANLQFFAIFLVFRRILAVLIV